MKKFYLLSALALCVNVVFAQCPFQVTQTNVLCSGQCNGTATAFPSGPPPYTYQWSTTPTQTTQTATGLCAGTYSIIVINGNNCTAVQTVNITQPQPLQCITTGQNATCGNCNGVAVATSFGGTPNYTYNWAPTGQTTSNCTGLCSGVYTFTVTDANGCTCQSIVTIANSNSNLQATSTGQNPLCSNCNGMVSATATGGQGPYSYSWTPSGCTTQTCTGLCSGTYTCIITDANGCTASTVHTLTPTGNLQVTCTGQNPNTCINCNGMTIVSASGGTAPYSYSWSPSGCTTQTCTGLCAGTYTCVVTDANGCTGMSTWTLTGPQGPQFSISGTMAQSPNCNNGTLTAAPGSPGTYTYSWNTSPVQTTQTATGLSPGIYTCCMTNVQNGCMTCQPGTISCVTGISTNDADASVNIYPNPASHVITIDYTAENDGAVQLEIMNIVGEDIYTQHLNASKQFSKQIDVSAFAKGIYFVRISNSKGRMTQKLIIE